MSNQNHCKEEIEHHHPHDHGGFKEELLHHLPYAIFSIALSMILLSILYNPSNVQHFGHHHGHSHSHGGCSLSYFNVLFHSFHFLHVLFAATGTVITFCRYSRSILGAIIVGTISPMVFCTLSDVLLPYLSGIILGVDMDLHICFHTELANVVPFLIIGIINGLILKLHHSGMLKFFSLGSHFIHILISSLASLFYMVSHGFDNWQNMMGILFIFKIFAIVIPCTFSDVIVPMYFAKMTKK